MNNIRKLRKAHGLTQKELADMVGVSESAINQYENGRKNPKYETLLRLGEALDCGISEIAGDDALEDLGFSSIERIIIQKYRSLDEYGKKAVEAVLDAEASRKVIDLSDVAMVARGGKKIPAGYEEDLKKMVEIMLGDAEK